MELPFTGMERSRKNLEGRKQEFSFGKDRLRCLVDIYVELSSRESIWRGNFYLFIYLFFRGNLFLKTTGYMLYWEELNRKPTNLFLVKYSWYFVTPTGLIHHQYFQHLRVSRERSPFHVSLPPLSLLPDESLTLTPYWNTRPIFSQLGWCFLPPKYFLSLSFLSSHTILKPHLPQFRATWQEPLVIVLQEQQSCSSKPAFLLSILWQN